MKQLAGLHDTRAWREFGGKEKHQRRRPRLREQAAPFPQSYARTLSGYFPKFHKCPIECFDFRGERSTPPPQRRQSLKVTELIRRGPYTVATRVESFGIAINPRDIR